MSDAGTRALVERLATDLLQQRLKLVTAESCTGGGIAHALTDLAGSSRWFERGFVTYSNEAKRELLGVSDDIFNRHGAVSEACAAAMVQGAINNSHGDIAVSVTGISGPEGGSADKPVGTVCFAWCLRGGPTLSTRTVFPGDRAAVRRQAVLLALQGLLDLVAEKLGSE